MSLSFQRILFYNPPGGKYQRGEDRCQSYIDYSVTENVRAPNDLGVMAAVARQFYIQPFLRDYPIEKRNQQPANLQTLLDDIETLHPQMVVMSITNASLLDDLQTFHAIKTNDPAILTLAKGAFFYTADESQFTHPLFQAMDLAIYGEADTLFARFLDALLNGIPYAEIPGILYQIQKSPPVFKRTPPAPFCTDLDAIPFPARDLINNNAYTLPNNEEPLATIQVARGCPSACTFCLGPIISGKKIRKRSPQNILNEIVECVERYGIRNFFFRADTFTFDEGWVQDFCHTIIQSGLQIRWMANSKVKPINEETLQLMKKAGCWVVAFGVESGNDETLRRIRKHTTQSDARRAVQTAHRLGLMTYCFYMIGFPWEQRQDILQTFRFALELNSHFIEIHIVLPFAGTALYEEYVEKQGLVNNSIGNDYFAHAGTPLLSDSELTGADLVRLRSDFLRRYYYRPSYIVRAFTKIRSIKEFTQYVRHAFKVLFLK